jgi:hypothetical protein
MASIGLPGFSGFAELQVAFRIAGGEVSRSINPMQDLSLFV